MDDLILKYLTETATDEEKRTLEEWVNLSDENRSYFLFNKNIYNVANPPFDPQKIDEEAALRKVMRKTTPLIKRKLVRQIAAAILFLSFMSATVLGLVTMMKSEPQKIVAVEKERKQTEAILTLATGEKVVLEKGATKSISDANGVTINMEGGGIKYDAVAETPNKEQFNELYVPRSGEFYLVLDDGTKVWINADTKLKYPTRFIGGERKVYLEGEAYFEVTPDKTRPFRVISPSQDVLVLGTSFDVCAYNNSSEMFVTLASGKVEVEAKISGQKTILKPGEQAVILKADGKMETRSVDVTLYGGWRYGKLVFSSNSLESIFEQLSRYYDVDSVVWEEESLKQIKFSGEMKKYEDVAKVLELMERTGDVKFELKNNTIVVKK